MKVSIFGLGYVGAVSAACLAGDGHDVVGVDPNPTKVDLINAGRSPVIEDAVDGLVSAGVADRHLRATTSCDKAVKDTDLAFVCVGTPSQSNGSLDLRYVRRVCEDIGNALRDRDDFFVVVLRSTLLPGTTMEVAIPVLEERSGKRVGRDFGVCVHPEFLREGSAVRDYRQPPKVVIGASDARSRALLTQIAEQPPAPTVQTEIPIAEMVKYADNTWHAVKVAFANEIGSLAKAQGIDGRAVMEIFRTDEKLNLSGAYLRPGFAFGGSCLPKDVRAMTYRGRTLDLELPLIESVLPSNTQHLRRAYRLVTSEGHRRIGILGLSFKAGTDDLRESPTVELVEWLIGKGHDLTIYDPNVSMAKLMGANREYIINQIPHISKLMVDRPEDLFEQAETIVVGTDDPEYRTVLDRFAERHRIIDLVRLGPPKGGTYDGICW